MSDLKGVDVVEGRIHIVDLLHDRIQRIFDMGFCRRFLFVEGLGMGSQAGGEEEYTQYVWAKAQDFVLW